MQTLRTIRVGKEEWDVFLSNAELTNKKARECLELFGHGWEIPSVSDLQTIIQYHKINDLMDALPQRLYHENAAPHFWSSSQVDDNNYSYGWHAVKAANVSTIPTHPATKNNVCFLKKKPLDNGT